MSDFNVDTRRLFALLGKLSQKERTRMLKNAMRRSSTDIKKHAQGILLQSLRHLSNRTSMKRGIWTKVYTSSPGFLVTVAGNKHCYTPLDIRKVTDSDGRKRTVKKKKRSVPLARWLETGTDARTTRKGGYTRGTLQSIGFLEETLDQKAPRTVAYLEDEIINQIKKTAKKYE